MRRRCTTRLRKTLRKQLRRPTPTGFNCPGCGRPTTWWIWSPGVECRRCERQWYMGLPSGRLYERPKSHTLVLSYRNDDGSDTTCVRCRKSAVECCCTGGPTDGSPECTCYEVPGHMPGCPMRRRIS